MNINEYQDFVFSINSYNKDKSLNKVWIIDGREPNNSNEILVDASIIKLGYEVGDVLNIKHDNIKEQEYVIVGLIRSPYFISIERGTSTLLNGKIDHFIYMMEENFNYDGLYNRGNIILNTDKKAFTDEYNNYVKEVVKKIENASKEISKERKETFLKEKEEEYNKAYAEFKDKETLALNELNGVKEQITSGETLITESETKILSDNEVDIYLDNAKTKLDTAKAQLDSSKATLDMAKQMIASIGVAPDMNLDYLKGKLNTSKNSLQRVNGYSNTLHYTYDRNSKIDKIVNNYQ